MDPGAMLAIFSLVIGAYLIYGAITGKGKAFDDDGIRDECKVQYRKAMRMFCAIVGPVFLANGALDYYMTSHPDPVLRVVSTVLYGLTLVGIAALIVLFVKMRKPIK